VALKYISLEEDDSIVSAVWFGRRIRLALPFLSFLFFSIPFLLRSVRQVEYQVLGCLIYYATLHYTTLHILYCTSAPHQVILVGHTSISPYQI
jgi:hypothetical protein